jgi:hypothetical protein
MSVLDLEQAMLMSTMCTTVPYVREDALNSLLGSLLVFCADMVDLEVMSPKNTFEMWVVCALLCESI